MCSTTQFMVHHIPVVLHGDSSEKLFLYIHGKMGRKEEAARIAEIVCPKGYQVLGIDLPGHGERTGEMERFVPWEVVPELQAVYANTQKRWKKISLYANSIGAYFSLLALRDAKLEKSLFVSPILDMEKLIRDMMCWAGVTQEQLKEAGEIPTAFGETLSWSYLTYAAEHRITEWDSPTAILYAGHDHLTARETVDDFAKRFGCTVTVMENGEHWFHSEEQLAVLDAWLRKEI
ncbi:MAG: alpha/beta hydrolase [Candidatus Faecousia sp.]|nr:alpha/beta hydrolase [Candidatus Faecousia sp.]